MKNNLNIDEVMALVMMGKTAKEIRQINHATFGRLCDENPELEEHIDKANSILDRQDVQKIFSISCQDADFPERLLKIGQDCPAVIHCKGNIELLKEPKAVAIIGARSADREGYDKAYNLGKDYTQKGYVIVSGLALGCDTAAHRGCLDVGGQTIAIVGNGLDITHPKENFALQQEILEKGGLLLSEQIIGTKANPTRLVARNRLQSALSETVILAQCPEQSGSLHTMRFARQYKKKCFAATFPTRTLANAGNFDLIERHLAAPL